MSDCKLDYIGIYAHAWRCEGITDNAIVHKWTAGRLLLQGSTNSEAGKVQCFTSI